MTVTQFTDRKWDDNGNLVGQNSQSTTVEVDSRFAPKYRQFSENLGSSKNSLGSALAVMSGKASLKRHARSGTRHGQILRDGNRLKCGDAPAW